MAVRIFKPVLVMAFFMSLLAGCSVSEKQEIQTIYGFSMGTSYSVKVVSTLSESRRLQLGIESTLADINDRMSTYLPHSDISNFASSEINTPVEVDVKTIEVIEKALGIANITEGYFDPTVAPLVDLWGFGPTPRNSAVPSDNEIQSVLSNIGHNQVSVNVETNTLSKSAPRELDLSAIAKGYAVDRIAEYLHSRNVENYLVEVGGEMRLSGIKPDNVKWKIAIEKPDTSVRAAFRLLEVTDGAVATSGDYRNFFEIEGKRYSHTINPKTGYPVEHDLASVTVVMNDCMEADAFATAFMAMGKEMALQLAEDKKIAAFLIFKVGEEFESIQSTEFTRLFGL